MMKDNDLRFLQATIRLGQGQEGVTSPNPSVGCLIVNPETQAVIAQGVTAPGGRPHAESIALDKAGDKARGATAYVSLEPCNHTGKTPPCSLALIRAGIARLVVAVRDPDPRTGGAGLAACRDAGMDVVCLSDHRVDVHASHRIFIIKQRPHITLKMAVTSDGMIGSRKVPALPVSGPLSRSVVQAMRSRFDAIMVGSGTVLADHPLLTCRLPGLQHRSPHRIILDRSGRLNTSLALWNDHSSPVTIFTGPSGEKALAKWAPEKNVTVHCIEADASSDFLRTVLYHLAEEDMRSVLLEGGAHLASAFLHAGLIDRCYLFQSRKTLADILQRPVEHNEAVAAFETAGPEWIANSKDFRLDARRLYGEDMLSIYHKVTES
jgi:diaminohydroxyphosphoribosylaminopyrimidine deaminase/5-amino-6-(5-phosphoribosylamino)uracil reductase